MSLHKSLKPRKQKHKSVAKRYERMRSLILQNKWDKENSSVFKLPKEKRLKTKIKKEKEEEKKEETNG